MMWSAGVSLLSRSALCDNVMRQEADSGGEPCRVTHYATIASRPTTNDDRPIR